MKVDSISLIPMTKESIFEEESTIEASSIPENDGLTYSKDAWLTAAKKRFTNAAEYYGGNRNICLSTMSWVADNMDCVGFMLMPTALYKDDNTQEVIPLSAKTSRIEDFEKFTEYVKLIGGKFFPYTVEFVANMPMTTTIDSTTFEVKSLPYPEISTSGGYWLVRYELLDEKNEVYID